MEIFKIITLVLSGLLLLFVGAARLSNPIKTYHKNSGIKLPNDIDLLNEMKGVSAVMLLGGITVLLGTIVPAITTSSFGVGTLILVGFAIGRLVSIGTDGKPNKQILQGIVFEVVLGAMNIVCLTVTLL